MKKLINWVMGRYMKVVLKDKYKNDLFIQSLNGKLSSRYGANTWEKFNPWYFLQEEADYINNHPEGQKQLPGWQRPITPQKLSNNFFWLKHGVFTIKLSGGITAREGRDAVAICKWIINTQGKYIDTENSSNYDKATVAEYLNAVFIDDGYDLEKLWELNNRNKIQ